MDENSEGYMETDVSSTTDDVLESQKVTASDGNVEMVIVVENVSEDSVSTLEGEDPPKVDNSVTSVSLTDYKSKPQADKETIPSSCSNIYSKVTQKSPTTNSPERVSNLQYSTKEAANVTITRSPANEITEKVLSTGCTVKDVSPSKASSESPVKESLSNQTSNKSIETADSTKTEPSPPSIKEKSTERIPVKTSSEIKTIVLKAPLKVYRPSDKSPLKDIMLEKTVPVATKENITVEAITSPAKEAANSPANETTNLSTKEATNSSSKEASNSPIKEVIISPTQKTTKEETKLSTSKEATKLSPSKEATKLLPNKVATKLSTDKEATKLSPGKEATKLSPSKEATNLAPTRETIKLSTSKEATKLLPSKEAIKLSPSKEATKLSLSKEATKLSTDKEVTKLSPTKEAIKLEPTKEAMKRSPNNEAIKLLFITEATKLSTSKETTKLSPSKEATKLSSDKEATKLSSTKEVTNTAKEVTRPTKEVIKPSPIKESTLITTNINGKVLSPNENEDILDKTVDSSKDEISPMDIDKDSNSQASDTSEKEHNKSISRELRSLINSAKESKIISECNQVTSKTRKSRNADTSLNISVDAERIQGNRRGSNNSQISNCSEKSDKTAQKRSMRSQNPEFVSKCKQFLNAVTSKVMKDPDEAMSENDASAKEKEQGKPKTGTNSAPSTPKRQKMDEPREQKPNKLRSDPYCWRCHYIVEEEINEKAHPPIVCTVCPRSFHYKCLTANERKVAPEKNWVCPDCLQILQAESSETRSPAMKKITLGMLCELLKYALERMMDLNGVEPFLNPVDRTSFPDYDKYVVHPMDLNQMKQNIADGHYGSTEAFVADTQWILHNSIIFNTLQSKLTGGARALVRSCRAEMGEIEACPECYSGAHARRSTWFTDVCSTPHILLWAKLKGFPYWPAKGMTVNSSGLIDVRFFGAHDRAWVPAKDCFLYSEKDPNSFRTKRQDILDSMQEAEHHIRNISRKFGKFVYPPFKTQFDPTKMTEQLKMMIPTFEGEIKLPIKDKVHSPAASKDKRRSNSKSSKTSTNEGDVSECDDAKKSEAETSKDEINTSKNNVTNEKNKTIDMPTTPKQKDTEVIPSRKRRRSKLEEAVLTIMEPTVEKKKKIDFNSTAIESNSSKDDKTKNSKKKDEQLDKEVTESVKKVTETKTKEKAPKDNEPSSSTSDQESQRVTPIKLVALPRTNKLTPKLFATTKVSPKPSPKEDEKVKDPQKSKKAKLIVNEKEKRRNSRNRSSINATSTPKADKNAEKKTDTDSNKEKEVKSKEGSSRKKDSDSNNANNSSLKAKPVTPSNKDSLFDDDTNLAVLARESRNSNSGLPTITSVRSLSTTAQNTSTTSKRTTTIAKSTETIEANSGSSIFTPTGTDNVRNMKDAVSKLQKLRSDVEPLVGRVGVKAFARMTEPNQNDDVQVEIKAEPIDLDEENEERQMEKMDLMNACKLRPVSQVQNQPQTQSQKTSNLRDVRINKVVVTPTVVAKKTRVEIRPRAKKTFPQPKRTEEGRSELNGKNSMVYIPIQPPMTQAPVRGVRPGANGPNAGPRPTLPVTSVNSINTVTSPLRPTISTPPNNATPPTMSNATPLANQVANVNQVSSVGQVPTVGPTTVHTVPLMTSVNGQWMFSLQPVMSVGGIENTPAPVNGVPERSPGAQPFVSITPNTPQNKTSDTLTPVEMPRLQQRPTLVNPLADNAPLGVMPTPSTAGPLTAKLNQNAVKLTDFFRNLLEDTIERVEEPVVQAHALKLQLEQTRWRHQQEIDELKHNHELSLAEMRTSLEKEKLRAVTELRRTAQLELENAVKTAKSKQWCANCSQEAQFYCCWNTSYCDYPCQRAHWPLHFSHCTQQRGQDTDNEETDESRPQTQTDNLPKSAPIKTPALTVGGKAAPTSAPGATGVTRVYAHDSVQSKSSIIVSMVEDGATGNQTMKCVGTYKSPQTPQNVAPLIINKQLLNEDSATKKVVTSGGYLIVGAAPSSNSTSVITPAPSRRPHTIQYYT